MPKQIHGDLSATGRRFGIVVSRFNDFITSRLVDGAIDAITRHGGDAESVTVVHVPGAFEVPAAARALAEKGGVDAVIGLGCVIRGHTPHFEYVAGEAARGLGWVALHTGVPTAFGILTTDTLEQAIERAGSKAGNKGAEAALSAIEMIGVLQQIGQSGT